MKANSVCVFYETGSSQLVWSFPVSSLLCFQFPLPITQWSGANPNCELRHLQLQLPIAQVCQTAYIPSHRHIHKHVCMHMYVCVHTWRMPTSQRVVCLYIYSTKNRQLNWNNWNNSCGPTKYARFVCLWSLSVVVCAFGPCFIFSFHLMECRLQINKLLSSSWIVIVANETKTIIALCMPF